MGEDGNEAPMNVVMSQVAAAGGPVYPVALDFGAEGKFTSAGMFIRDWLAGLALQGMLANGDGGAPDTAARWAYTYADAMLKAREAGGG